MEKGDDYRYKGTKIVLEQRTKMRGTLLVGGRKQREEGHGERKYKRHKGRKQEKAKQIPG